MDQALHTDELLWCIGAVPYKVGSWPCHDQSRRIIRPQTCQHSWAVRKSFCQPLCADGFGAQNEQRSMASPITHLCRPRSRAVAAVVLRNVMQGRVPRSAALHSLLNCPLLNRIIGCHYTSPIHQLPRGRGGLSHASGKYTTSALLSAGSLSCLIQVDHGGSTALMYSCTGICIFR